MLALSLYQPWATLVMIGAKRIETRSWSTDHRGAIFLHASKKKSREQINLWHEEPFHSVLREAGIRRWQDLPLGAVLGTVEIIDCKPIVAEYVPTAAGLSEWHEEQDATGMQPPPEPERSFGNYGPGRFAWMLDRPNKFNTPIPHPGRQRLFNIHPQALGLQ